MHGEHPVGKPVRCQLRVLDSETKTLEASGAIHFPTGCLAMSHKLPRAPPPHLCAAFPHKPLRACQNDYFPVCQGELLWGCGGGDRGPRVYEAPNVSEQ